MSAAVSKAMQVFDKIRDGKGWGTEEDECLAYALIGIGQELSIANGLAIAALTQDSGERERIIEIARGAVFDANGQPR